MNLVAIITAGGSGKRFGSDLPKQLLLLDGKAIITYPVNRFLQDERFQEIIITVPEKYRSHFEELFPQERVRVVAGGAERQDSVRLGLEAAQTSDAVVFIHDGVRPFIQSDEIEALLGAVQQFGAAALGHPLTRTIKRMDADQFAVSTPNREDYWEIYTPQCFDLATIRDLHRKAQADQRQVTDDAALYEYYCGKVKLIASRGAALKITFPQDLVLAHLWQEQISFR